MGTFRDDFRQTADDLRTLSGPDSFDIRVDKLTILQRVWSGGRRGAYGGYTETVFADLPQIYKIRNVTTREIQGSGGKYEEGDLRFGAVTAQFDTGTESGGWSVATLHPVSNDDGTEYIYRLTGEHQGDYHLQFIDNLKPFSTYLVLRRIENTPGPQDTTENPDQF